MTVCALLASASAESNRYFFQGGAYYPMNYYGQGRFMSNDYNPAYYYNPASPYRLYKREADSEPNFAYNTKVAHPNGAYYEFGANVNDEIGQGRSYQMHRQQQMIRPAYRFQPAMNRFEGERRQQYVAFSPYQNYMGQYRFDYGSEGKRQQQQYGQMILDNAGRFRFMDQEGQNRLFNKRESAFEYEVASDHPAERRNYMDGSESAFEYEVSADHPAERNYMDGSFRGYQQREPFKFQSMYYSPSYAYQARPYIYNGLYNPVKVYAQMYPKF